MTIKLRIYNDFKMTNKCRLYIAQEWLYPDQTAFALPKNGYMTDIYNRE